MEGNDCQPPLLSPALEQELVVALLECQRGSFYPWTAKVEVRVVVAFTGLGSMVKLKANCCLGMISTECTSAWSCCQLRNGTHNQLLWSLMNS